LNVKKTETENGKMRLVETIFGMGEDGMKENDGGGEFNYDFCKCYMYPQYNDNMINKNIFKKKDVE
jgi:hypothetical protein